MTEQYIDIEDLPERANRGKKRGPTSFWRKLIAMPEGKAVDVTDRYLHDGKPFHNAYRAVQASAKRHGLRVTVRQGRIYVYRPKGAER